MRINAHKEKIIFEKRKKIETVEVSKVKPTNVSQDIDKIQKNKENIYLFSSGDKADFLYKRSCVNDLSFNYFQIYNKSVYLCLKEIIKITKNLCEKRNVDTEKTTYFIASEHEVEFLEDYWYDTGGIEIPSFSGYWFLKTKKDSWIDINNKKYDVSDGSVIVFEASSKILFSGISEAISFNISTLSRIEGQYPQKWMPIIFLQEGDV